MIPSWKKLKKVEKRWKKLVDEDINLILAAYVQVQVEEQWGVWVLQVEEAQQTGPDINLQWQL